MSRRVPRPLLTDACLALVLLLLTLGPSLVKGVLDPANPSVSLGLVAALPGDDGWWVFSALIVAGLVARHPSPMVALALTGAGVAGHLMIPAKVAPLDLALPLVLYTVATAARSRRMSLTALAVGLVLTYAATLGGRLEEDRRSATQLTVKVAIEPPPAKVVTRTPPPPSPAVSADQLAGAGQAAMELMLLLVAAFAVGDAMRSRRAHLAAVEQRTADLARAERQRAAVAVAAERARITRELHDVVAHGMSVMVVQAQGAAAALERRPDRAAAALQHVIEVGRASLAEMRLLLDAGRVDPAQDARLEPLPGVAAVPALVEQLRSTGMRIDLHTDGEPAAVPAAVDLSAYRIVQEALTNTMKHAGPDAGAVVRLRFEPDCLRLAVTDDGPGRGIAPDGRGNGLRGIAERVTMLGGTLRAGPGDGGGFRIDAALPFRTDPLARVPR